MSRFSKMRWQKFVGTERRAMRLSVLDGAGDHQRVLTISVGVDKRKNEAQ
jgi:hypothetical protein